MEQKKETQHPEEGFLMFVAENSGIITEDLEKLFYNGFDNPESFSLIKEEDLGQLGMQEGTNLVFDKIQATLEVWREYLQKTGANQGNINPILEEANEGQISL